ncbi:fasciclin domain-containing protein [Lacinutrix sp. Bg11-31]|uniref:fasciclin domain-containing protein n=1 Tax=Lacinutrix sp. Bg11-31 TaxID=2057808 RepID=UPI000C30159F|nr:fasciclin domain-containing protein [Lacinutrix sp. Bg11-31]AUC82118.1 adhesin [Lacinutrix sp. Bg11-31]
MKNLRKLPLVLLVVTLFWSCSNDDDTTAIATSQELNIVQTAQATADLSSLVAAVLEADLATTLSGSGPFTVLAPTNAAFSEFLSTNGWANVTEIPDATLTQVLLNHVISGTVDAATLTALGVGYTNTLADGAGGNKMSLYFDTSSGVTFNNLGTVTTADISASNGTVHIIDKVLTLPSVVDHALSNAGFSNLVAALGAADGDLVTALSGTGPFTVLAPDDTAFGTFLSDNGFANLAAVPTDVLSQVLLNHVISGAISSTDLVGLGNGYTNSLASGAGTNAMSIYYNTDAGVVFNGISTVTTADVVGTNGIIHAVDTVIGLPTVVTFATADPNFSTLVSALTTLTPATDFASILSRTATGNGDGIDPDFTVFAPTNDAFAAITVPTDEAVLTSVLLHHVIGGANVASGDLTPNGDTTATSLEGDNLTVTLPGTGANIADMTDGSGNTDIGIIAVDVQASNGVIHVINKVLLPM